MKATGAHLGLGQVLRLYLFFLLVGLSHAELLTTFYFTLLWLSLFPSTWALSFVSSILAIYDAKLLSIPQEGVGSEQGEKPGQPLDDSLQV